MSVIENDDEFFGDDVEAKPLNPAQFRDQLQAMADEWSKHEEEVKVLEEMLETHKTAINRLKLDQIPQLMREAGTTVWKDDRTGNTIELETSVSSTLPKDIEKRNELLRKMIPIGIAEIVGEEMNMTFIPQDPRVPAMQRLLGLNEVDNFIEDEKTEKAPELTNYQVELIDNLREELGWNKENLPVDVKLGVHHSRLKAWLKRKIDAGFGAQISEAGIWHGKQAKKTAGK